MIDLLGNKIDVGQQCMLVLDNLSVVTATVVDTGSCRTVMCNYFEDEVYTADSHSVLILNKDTRSRIKIGVPIGNYVLVPSFDKKFSIGRIMHTNTSRLYASVGTNFGVELHLWGHCVPVTEEESVYIKLCLGE